MEPDTIRQAQQASRLPFLAGPLALMPDAHIGKGATIGSVIPTQGAIIPAAVGVDIGCGMIAVETYLTSFDLPDDLHDVLSWCEHRIPAGVGQGHHYTGALWADFVGHHPLTGIIESTKQESTAAKQFGTLGSGNHFVEVCLDERDTVWLVLHSGSRGIGNQLAQKHIKEAQRLMADFHIKLEDRDLAYLPESTDEFDAYMMDLRWAQAYAFGNRAAMMDALVEGMEKIIGAPNIEVDRINCHHNYTEQEHHHGKNVWVTRKGAIRARVGDRGVIPGSMGTGSFIVTGLGNPASYCSASHGAGRRMSRSKARNTLTPESLTDMMGDRTWNADRAKSLVDEHPLAYKEIGAVMSAQADLVSVDHHLNQVLNYKG